jgi:hypothetical protein
MTQEAKIILPSIKAIQKGRRGFILKYNTCRFTIKNEVVWQRFNTDCGGDITLCQIYK